ncbi:MAG: UbiD family decarboxylase [Rhodospirillales bacterium]|jgi:UbiD family decarboxylase|nr:UbiD family decarboxylase [Rhodospirillales bacterium]MDP6642519.1 UbiD family decarboxylase [Rhodospirillales bacterium]
MPAKTKSEFDFDKFRLRSFVDRINDMGEVDILEDPVPLIKMSEIIESNPKAILFKNAGPEGHEIIAKSMGSRARLAAAFDTTPDKVLGEYDKRLANPKKAVEVPGDEAPVRGAVMTGDDIDLTRLPFHPQHEFDGSCYISCGIDYTIDPVTGRSNVGSRRLSLRNKTQTGTNVTAPSDLKRIYEGCVARGESLPITFTVGAHPLDMFAATTRLPGDEVNLVGTFRGQDAPVVKGLTNDICAPADAEMIFEGYLDERGYVEPEGPFGEYMGYYGAIHMDPVFTCTAVTMRKDVLHQTLLHGSAFSLQDGDGPSMSALRTEADAMNILRSAVSQPVAAHLRQTSGGSNTLRVSIKQRRVGEARSAIHALFGGIMRLKHVYVFDDDIDIFNDYQVEWAMGTRFQADEDIVMLMGMMGMTMDPSLKGRRTGAKAGFDCTKELGRDNDIPLTRCAAKIFDGPARFQTVEQALQSGPMFYAHIVEALGSDDGREIAMELDNLRQDGRLGRDRDGKYHLSSADKGSTGIVGDLYHDPNVGT